MDPTPPGLSIPEAARTAGVTRPALYRAMGEGKLAWGRVGKRRRIDAASFATWMAHRRPRPAPSNTHDQ